MTTPPDDELREFWERLLLVLRDATSTAQFLYDSTLNGRGGHTRPRPALPTVHPALLKLGMKRPGDWWPGEGFYTTWSEGEDPPELLCNKCHGEGPAEGGPCPWCFTDRTTGRRGLRRFTVEDFLAARRGAAVWPLAIPSDATEAGAGPAPEGGGGSAGDDGAGRPAAGEQREDEADDDAVRPRVPRMRLAPRALDLEARFEDLLGFVTRSPNAAALEAIRPRLDDLEDAQVGALVLDRVLHDEEELFATYQLREALELDV